jgi:hypothetical protein
MNVKTSEMGAVNNGGPFWARFQVYVIVCLFTSVTAFKSVCVSVRLWLCVCLCVFCVFLSTSEMGAVDNGFRQVFRFENLLISV